jgi:hypothetical protein
MVGSGAEWIGDRDEAVSLVAVRHAARVAGRRSDQGPSSRLRRHIPRRIPGCRSWSMREHTEIFRFYPDRSDQWTFAGMAGGS